MPNMNSGGFDYQFMGGNNIEYTNPNNNNNGFNNYNQISEENQIFQSLRYVQEFYNEFVSLNQQNYGYKFRVKSQYAPRFFVIKSFTEEDIHKVKKGFIIIN